MIQLLVVLALTPSQEGIVGPDRTPSVPAASQPDPIVLWNNQALQAIRQARTPPPLAARNLAMLHVAIFDTVNAIDGKPYQHYLFERYAIEPMTHEVAVAACAAEILSSLYPSQEARFSRLRNQILTSAASGRPRSLAKGLGEYVGRQMLLARRGDGHDSPGNYSISLDPGVWRPTPPDYACATLPNFGKTKRFGLSEKFDVKLVPPPRLDSEEFLRDLEEVRKIGGLQSTSRTAAQTLIAHYWNDEVGTVTPPGHWNQIAQAATANQPFEITRKARLFALLNLALADAAVVCWDCKYRYRLWRPVTTIRQSNTAWMPLLNTPSFPSYVSGHSTFSGAAAAVLADVLGKDEVEFSVGSDGVPGMDRTYKGFREAAREAGRSRIYGGIHYECDNREGLALGERIAREILRTRLLPPADATKPNRLPMDDGTRPSLRGSDVDTASAHRVRP